MSAQWWEVDPPATPQAQAQPSQNWWDEDPVSEQSQNPTSQPRSLTRSVVESPLGAGELLLSGATSTLASIPAGLGGLAALGANLFRDTPIDAAGVVTNIRDKYTYEPRSESAEQIGGLIGEGAQWVDRKALTPVLARIGEVSPTAENVVRTAVPAVAEAAGTLYGGGIGVRSVKRAATREPRPSRMTADQIAARMNERQSVGAAAAPVDLSRASPELRAAIEAAHAQGQTINPTVLARHVEAESLPVPVRLSEGQATQDATIISNEMNRRGRHEALAQHFATQNKALAENLREIRDSVGPNVFSTDMVSHGETLINAYRVKHATAQADINAKYAALRQAAGGDIPVDAKRVWETAESRLKKDLLFEHAPKAIMVQLRAMRDRGMNFEQFEALRTNLAEIQRSHTASGLERRAAGVIRQALEDIPLQPSAAHLKTLADEARLAARAHFKELEADPAYAAAVEGRVTPDQFARKFVIGGSRDHVGLMRKNLEHDETALQTMGVAVLDHLRDQARLNPSYEGNFAAASFDKAVRQLDPKIRHILTPEAAETLSRLANVSKYVTNQPRGSFVNTSNTFVSMAGDAAARTAEGVTNFKFGGLPVGTLLRAAGDRLGQGRAAKRSLSPGAGLGYVDPAVPPVARAPGARMAQSAAEPPPPQPMTGELMPREPLALPAPEMVAGMRSAPGTAFSREQMGMTPDVERAGALHPSAPRQTERTAPALPLLPPREAPPIVIDAQGRAALAPELAAYLDEIGLAEVRGARQPRAEPAPNQNLFAQLARAQEAERAGAAFDAERAAAAQAAQGGMEVIEFPRRAVREITLESPETNNVRRLEPRVAARSAVASRSQALPSVREIESEMRALERRAAALPADSPELIELDARYQTLLEELEVAKNRRNRTEQLSGPR